MKLCILVAHVDTAQHIMFCFNIYLFTLPVNIY